MQTSASRDLTGVNSAQRRLRHHHNVAVEAHTSHNGNRKEGAGPPSLAAWYLYLSRMAP